MSIRRVRIVKPCPKCGCELERTWECKGLICRNYECKENGQYYREPLPIDVALRDLGQPGLFEVED